MPSARSSSTRSSRSRRTPRGRCPTHCRRAARAPCASADSRSTSASAGSSPATDSATPSAPSPAWIGSGKGAAGQNARAFYLIPMRILPADVRRVARQRLRARSRAARQRGLGRLLPVSEDLARRHGRGLRVLLRRRGRRCGPLPRFLDIWSVGTRVFRGAAKGQLELRARGRRSDRRHREAASPARSARTSTIALTCSTSRSAISSTLPWAPNLMFQYDDASGDEDPFDGDNERFNTLFGDRRFEFDDDRDLRPVQSQQLARARAAPHVGAERAPARNAALPLVSARRRARHVGRHRRARPDRARRRLAGPPARRVDHVGRDPGPARRSRRASSTSGSAASRTQTGVRGRTVIRPTSTSWRPRASERVDSKAPACESRHNRPSVHIEIEPCCCDDCCRSCLVVALAPSAALADEGMWTFDNFPSALVRERYGVDIDGAWLDRVRRGTVRLAGCTASFVSPDGLLLTNHHCVASCLAQNSTRESSLLETGFIAPDRGRELDCPVQIADVLEKLENVTAAVQEATRGLDEQAANERRRQTLTALEATCEQTSRTAGNPLKCEAVTLYGGGQFWLYQYRRYDDVRLVFAPEADIAAFGGDPDNFQFPRWCLDFSLLRAYENGRPAATPQHLTIDFDGPAAGRARVRRGPSRLDGSPAHRGGAPNAARPDPAARVAAGVRAPRPLQPIRQDGRRGQPDRAGRAVRTRERPQGAAQAARRIARRRAAGREARRGIGPAHAREPQPRAGSRDRRSVGAHRSGASRAKPRAGCPTSSSKAAQASTAASPATRARWCAPPPSGRSRTASGCASSRTASCRAWSSSLRRRCRSIPSSNA